jgi:hypothetical protein
MCYASSVRTVVVVVGIVGTVATTVLVGRHWLRARECSGDPGRSEPFDAERWSDCSGPHRIAIAHDLEDHDRLIGRPLSDAIAQLGPLDTDPDGDRGWLLGETEGSPSLFPVELMLAVRTDAHDVITTARVVDTFEGPPLGK